MFLRIHHEFKKFYVYTRKYSLRGFCLAPPGAAEDNVEERENSEVAQFFLVLHVTGYVRTDVRTDVWTGRPGS